MNIFIIENEPLTILGLKQKINEINPTVRIATSLSFDAADYLMGQSPFNLIIVDIDIKGKVGTGSVGALKQKHPQASILVITDLDERIYGLPYMKAGADGFLSKLAPAGQFDEAIRTMMALGKYASSTLQQIMIQEALAQRSREYVNPLLNISVREKQVMEFLINGKSTGEIAELLKINKTTVGTHKMRILKKMQVTNLIKLMEKVTMLS